MTEQRKPPPMYAVWNETHGFFESHLFTDRVAAQLGVLRSKQNFPSEEFRIITLIEQPEPPQ